MKDREGTHYVGDDCPGGHGARAASNRCTHWNDRLSDGTPLRPVRCLGTEGHDGQHYGGGATWGEALGFRQHGQEPTDD